MKTTVHDIAAYILKSRGAMSAMKLQKLVYYSQAWACTLLGHRLFPEKIQAWANGPVVYELFDQHRGTFIVSEWGQGSAFRLSEQDQQLIGAVLGHYGVMSPAELSKLTHDEQPWIQARSGTPEGFRSSQEIPVESMKAFYGQAVPPFPWPATGV